MTISDILSIFSLKEKVKLLLVSVNGLSLFLEFIIARARSLLESDISIFIIYKL
jgi:hypothetical protein